MDDIAKPADPPEKEDRLTRFARMFRATIGSTAIGTGGGGLLGLVALAIDKTGIAAAVTTIGGASLGLIRGFNIERARSRREMIDAEAGADRVARIEAERRAADAERKLAECEARYVTLTRRFDSLEASHNEMSGRLDRMRADYDSSIAKAEDRYSRLWERYEGDRNKGLRSDQPGAVS